MRRPTYEDLKEEIQKKEEEEIKKKEQLIEEEQNKGQAQNKERIGRLQDDKKALRREIKMYRDQQIALIGNFYFIFFISFDFCHLANLIITNS